MIIHTTTHARAGTRFNPLVARASIARSLSLARGNRFPSLSRTSVRRRRVRRACGLPRVAYGNNRRLRGTGHGWKGMGRRTRAECGRVGGGRSAARALAAGRELVAAVAAAL